jgi:molecular chaperone DnaK (HSP70)
MKQNSFGRSAIFFVLVMLAGAIQNAEAQNKKRSAFDSKISTSRVPIEMEPASAASLRYPIGIETSEGFSEMIAANKPLPLTYSETFANSQDNQSNVSVELFQKTASGMEKIVEVRIDIPPRPTAKASVIITLKISAKKELRVKGTVTETGWVKEYGPFPVQ